MENLIPYLMHVFMMFYETCGLEFEVDVIAGKMQPAY